MTKQIVGLGVFLLTSSVLLAGGLQDVYDKLPSGTVGFVATAGSENYGNAFSQTSMGQICKDPQVQTFIQQIVEAVSNIKNADIPVEKAKEPLAFAETILKYPTALGFILNPEDSEKPPVGFLVSRAAAGRTDIDGFISRQLVDTKMVIPRDIQGLSMYVVGDPNCPVPIYFGWIQDTFVAVVNDKDNVLVKQFASGRSSFSVPNFINSGSPDTNAFAGHINLKQLFILMAKEAAKDNDVQQMLEVLNQLGLAECRSFSLAGGFRDKNVVFRSKLDVPTSAGIWKAYQPVDHEFLKQLDAGAMQAGVAHINPATLYDTILGSLDTVKCDPNEMPRPKVEAFEKQQLGFKIRDFLASLEGTVAGYSLPAYSSPELPMGGYVLKAKLKDKKTFTQCMDKLGSLIASVSQGQMQVSSQTTASGNEIHIWAVSVMAMMQLIPAWAIQDDMVVIASHPSLAGRIVDQAASEGADNSIVSQPEFANLVKNVPPDAFAIGLSNSKATAKQCILSLQQFWPMIRMGMMKQGMNLPIMLPTIDKYIAEMEPGIRYGRKTADGLEWYYKGCGIEANNGTVAGAAMGAAILMPALSRAKMVARRVVSGTNLKSIGTACVVYANDHNDKFPDKLKVLIAECDVDPKTLESPRKPNNFDGPSYILIQGLTGAAPANIVLVYENPRICTKGGNDFNVLYADGHVAAVSKQELLDGLKKTYDYLGKPMPEISF